VGQSPGPDGGGEAGAGAGDGSPGGLDGVSVASFISVSGISCGGSEPIGGSGAGC
jgi:hypothetical protein